MSLGLAPSEFITKQVLTRGDMAILLYRALHSENATMPEESLDGGITLNEDGSINPPSDGSRYVPQEGDVIRCDDGTNYAITDVSRWDKNMFASGPVGDLPRADLRLVATSSARAASTGNAALLRQWP